MTTAGRSWNPHEWDVRVCPTCGALVPTTWQATHTQHHQEEAERVEAALLQRAHKAERR